jgi:hypothetical protein
MKKKLFLFISILTLASCSQEKELETVFNQLSEIKDGDKVMAMITCLQEKELIDIPENVNVMDVVDDGKIVRLAKAYLKKVNDGDQICNFNL